MKNTAALFFLLFMASMLAAQSDLELPDIHWGKIYNEPANSEFVKVIQANENGFYALRRKNARSGRDKFLVERYNAKMNLMKAQELELKYKRKWREFEDVIALNGRFYLLSSFYNEPKKRNYLFAQEFSRKSLLLKQEVVKIGEAAAKGINRQGVFDTRISRDSSKMLVYGESTLKRNAQQQFSLSVYTDDFLELWSREVTLPFVQKNFSIEDYHVDNKGNAYILGVLYSDGVRTRRKGLPTYEYVILAFRKEIEKPETYRIKNAQKFITDLTFRITGKGDIVCSGFFSEKGTYSIKGSYFAKIDINRQELINEKFTEFDFDFLTAGMSKRERERAVNAERKNNVMKEAELFEYKLDKLILRDDGGAVLVAEQFYIEEFVDYSNPHITTIGVDRGLNNQYFYEYYYNDIIVLNLKPDGTHQWVARIPKRQITTNDNGYFSSYAMTITGEKLYFIFNDNKKNYTPGNRNFGHTFGGSNSAIILAAVDRTGAVDMKPLFTNNKENLITRPKVCKQISKDKMMIFGEARKKFKFGKLVFWPTEKSE